MGWKQLEKQNRVQSKSLNYQLSQVSQAWSYVNKYLQRTAGCSRTCQ